MKIMLLSFCCTVVLASQAQQLIFEEDFNAGIPTSWYLVNADALTPAEAVDSFDNAWIPFIDGSDTCAASTSFYTPTGTSADYLISPRITLDTYSKLVWSARSYDASHPDGYIVLISTTDSLPASFTDTVYVKPEELYYWQKRSVQLDLEGYANEDVFIAIKNVTNDGFILMVDDVKVWSSNFANTAQQNEFSFSVYPNPVTNLLNISAPDAVERIEVINMLGETVIRTDQKGDIDVSMIQSGLYILQISVGNVTYNTTFSKQ